MTLCYHVHKVSAIVTDELSDQLVSATLPRIEKENH